MKAFTDLYLALDASTSTLDKLQALRRHLGQVAPRDAAWAAYLLAGGRPRRAVPTAELRALACAAAGLPDWLFEAGYAATGDLAEAIAYVLPTPTAQHGGSLADWMEDRIAPLRAIDPAARAIAVRDAWAGLTPDARFLYVKLVAGGFRVGVSRGLVQRALAELHGLPPALVAQRMMGYTDATRPPSAAAYLELTAAPAPEGSGPRGGQPYPFFLAQPLGAGPQVLGQRQDWMAEWKYDGIRAQVVKRESQVWIWSRGEELVTERFPEVAAEAAQWPDGTVVDGELLAWLPNTPDPAPFALLQKRIGRTKPSKAILAEAPVRLLAYDLLEIGGQDVRAQPLHQRRAQLDALGIPASPVLDAPDWAGLAALRSQARSHRVEGLMLKHRSSAYGLGRTGSGAAAWWKWKLAPLSVDAVLVYAQAGHGRRANLFTDYSFAVWSRPPANAAEAAAALEASLPRASKDALKSDLQKDGASDLRSDFQSDLKNVSESDLPNDLPSDLQLVSFAKAYSGLTDAEIQRVDKLVRQTTLEKFGPVRRVRPTLVFELGFEGLQASTRHKSGIAVRFPRMLRIRDDKPLHEADSLATLRDLMEAPDAPG